MPDVDDRIERLTAVHEIRQLAYRYAHAFDARDFATFRTLWADTEVPTELPVLDGHFCRSPAFEAAALQVGPSILFVGNHLIDVEDAEHARGKVYCQCQQDVDGVFMDQSILYDDRYVLQGGQWLFESREHLLFFGQRRASNPYDQPPANWPASPYGRGTLPEAFPTWPSVAAGS